jgi:CBS domain-containing protein
MHLDLSLPARVAMSTDIVVVQADVRVRDVVQRLAERDVAAAVVSDATGPIGVVSTRDIVRALGHGADLDASWAADDMLPELVWVMPEDPLADVVSVLADGWIEHVPVIDDGVVVGMVSAADILRAVHGPDVRTGRSNGSPRPE